MRLLLSILSISILSACSSTNDHTEKEYSISDKTNYIGYWQADRDSNYKNTSISISEIYKDGDTYMLNTDVNYEFLPKPPPNPMITQEEDEEISALTEGETGELIWSDNMGMAVVFKLTKDGEKLRTSMGNEPLSRVDEATVNKISEQIETCAELTEQYTLASSKTPPQNKQTVEEFADKFAPYEEVCKVPEKVKDKLRQR
ncbi:hypothetical protein ACT3TI_12695 [Psychrobacter sp. AOP22-C1-22]|uniref:hypothetical protein n=1 Tax=Psychrobacter TaxID=497 RepID=UPI001787975F|nr:MULTISPECIES: hypothetical protein [Psychrobacter]MBE0407731.1 hypothetical protein [Psychrobacter sp. FME6]